MIHHACPNCTTMLHSPDPNAGQMTDCPYCKHRLRIPGVPSGSSPPPTAPLPAPPRQEDRTPPEFRRIADEPPGKGGFAIAALVLGILSVVICFPPLVGLPFAVLALVFGILGRGSFETEGMAIGGIILGGVGLAIQFLWLVLFLTGLASYSPLPYFP